MWRRIWKIFGGSKQVQSVELEKAKEAGAQSHMGVLVAWCRKRVRRREGRTEGCRSPRFALLACAVCWASGTKDWHPTIRSRSIAWAVAHCALVSRPGLPLALRPWGARPCPPGNLPILSFVFGFPGRLVTVQVEDPMPIAHARVVCLPTHGQHGAPTEGRWFVASTSACLVVKSFLQNLRYNIFICIW